MKLFALISLALVPFTALADAAGDAVLAKSPFVVYTFNAYQSASQKIEHDRIRAVLSLNEKFLVELGKAKSAALKAERLADANAIDAKIKEITDANAALKDVLSGKPVVVATEPAVPYTGKQKGAVGELLKGNKLNPEQKKTLSEVLEGKLHFLNDNGTPFVFDENGNLKQGGKVFDAKVDSSAGTITYTTMSGGVCVIILSKIEGSKLPYTWNGRLSAGSISASTERSNTAPNSDPDSTLFGKRIK